MPQLTPYNPDFLHFGSSESNGDNNDAEDWVRWYIPRDGKEALFAIALPGAHATSRSIELTKAINDPAHSISADGPPDSEHYVKGYGLIEKAAQEVIDFIRNYATEVGSFWTMALVSLLQLFWTEPDPLMKYPERYPATTWRAVVKGDLNIAASFNLAPERLFSGPWNPATYIKGLEVLVNARWRGPVVAVQTMQSCNWTDYHMEINPSWLTTPDPNPHGTRRLHGEDWWPATPYAKG